LEDAFRAIPAFYNYLAIVLLAYFSRSAECGKSPTRFSPDKFTPEIQQRKSLAKIAFSAPFFHLHLWRLAWL
jgi:hypothetical protein